jgi:RNA polymerase sigma-70 factor (ECF subfamily)
LRITCNPSGPASAAEVAGVVDHLFRREAGRLVAILARRFGPEHLHLAEDVVQDALVAAMQTWPYTGVPENPTAWILQTARNRALDQTRRRKVFQEKQPALIALVEDCLDAAIGADLPRFEDEIQDSQLRMMFVCCHPGLPAESQVALTLKVLCGFGEGEIAAAFLATPEAMAKRLVRARQYLREEAIAPELPSAAEAAARVESVHRALYLLFNEGHKSSHGRALIRGELCADAIRLAELLAGHAFPTQEETHALLALMYFLAARLPARVDAAGDLLLLHRQDRSLWDRSKIMRGLEHLEESAGGPSVSRYHLEAGIAACHALAPSEEETDWTRILELYDDLSALDGSPVIALNRAVALARVQGPMAGLKALAGIADSPVLENYHLFFSVAGQLWLDHGDRGKAEECFRRSRDLATHETEREHLSRRIEQVRG